MQKNVRLNAILDLHDKLLKAGIVSGVATLLFGMINHAGAGGLFTALSAVAGFVTGAVLTVLVLTSTYLTVRGSLIPFWQNRRGQDIDISPFNRYLESNDDQFGLYYGNFGFLLIAWFVTWVLGMASPQFDYNLARVVFKLGTFAVVGNVALYLLIQGIKHFPAGMKASGRFLDRQINELDDFIHKYEGRHWHKNKENYRQIIEEGAKRCGIYTGVFVLSAILLTTGVGLPLVGHIFGLLGFAMLCIGVIAWGWTVRFGLPTLYYRVFEPMWKAIRTGEYVEQMNDRDGYNWNRYHNFGNLALNSAMYIMMGFAASLFGLLFLAGSSGIAAPILFLAVASTGITFVFASVNVVPAVIARMAFILYGSINAERAESLKDELRKNVKLVQKIVSGKEAADVVVEGADEQKTHQSGC